MEADREEKPGANVSSRTKRLAVAANALNNIAGTNYLAAIANLLAAIAYLLEVLLILD